MDMVTKINVASDIIWLRLKMNGDMTPRNLMSTMEKSLFYQGIGWLAREGRVSIRRIGWRKKVCLLK